MGALYKGMKNVSSFFGHKPKKDCEAVQTRRVGKKLFALWSFDSKINYSLDKKLALWRQKLVISTKIKRLASHSVAVMAAVTAVVGRKVGIWPVGRRTRMKTR